MKFRLLACLLLLAACQKKTATILVDDASPIAVAEILTADRAFNDEAKAKGTGPAFADFMDPTEGMLIQADSDPVKGRDAIFAANNDGIVPAPLTWAPDQAFAGKSGDFGASWGHWTYTGKRADGAPTVTTGKYVTVWHKNAKGEWKGLMDTGVTDKKVTGPASPAPTQTPTSPANEEPPEIIQPPGPNQPSAHP